MFNNDFEFYLDILRYEPNYTFFYFDYEEYCDYYQYNYNENMKKQELISDEYGDEEEIDYYEDYYPFDTLSDYYDYYNKDCDYDDEEPNGDDYLLIIALICSYLFVVNTTICSILFNKFF